MAQLKEKPQLIDIMIECGLTKSRGEGRRLITGGGVLLNGEKVTDEFREVAEQDFADGELMIKKGKKGIPSCEACLIGHGNERG